MNRKKFALVCENMVGLYVERRIQRTAAALSYFLTLSVFSMLICLYTMLGSFFPAGAELREMLSGLLPESTVDTVVEYMSYISENLSNT
ncbi:MAG: YihY/virulence factor BrkB family protein, partial [Oscillospiraceae bacterium]|nr:YihY/virulence factor BrkB family protein [Oscillospiraceae bacterium]